MPVESFTLSQAQVVQAVAEEHSAHPAPQAAQSAPLRKNPPRHSVQSVALEQAPQLALQAVQALLSTKNPSLHSVHSVSEHETQLAWAQATQ